MASLKDVADRAGVSITTVSHVINKTRRVSEPLTKRVNAAMDELNYFPNMVARYLRRKQTGTVGLVIPDIANPVFSNLARTVEATFRELDYHVIICNSSYTIENERENLTTLLTKRVDGIIIASSSPATDHIDKIASKAEIPVVHAISRPNLSAADCVRCDDRTAGAFAIQHLLELGHSRFAYLDRFEDHTYSVDRLEGARNAARDYGLDDSSIEVIRCDSYGHLSGYKAVRKLRGLSTEYTALIGYNDNIAVGALAALHEMGIDVPREVSLVGIDNIPIAPFLHPPLTTVDFPLQEIARSASELLFSRISEADRDNAKEMVFAPKLVVRETSSRPPS